MPTITTVDTTWTNGVAMDEAELRRADSAMFLGDGSNNGVRGGVVYHGPNSLAVSINGSDQVTVQSGAAVIPAATGLGVYRASLQSATSATAIDPRNATNPRIDLVVIRNTGAVDIITGTPSASPSAPALPAQAVELARITVPATGGGAATVSNAFRQYATSLGGILPVETAARLPGSGNQRGQRAIALDTGYEHRWSGSAWRLEGTFQAYTPTWTASGSAPTLGNGSLTGSYAWRAGMIEFRINLTFGTTSTAGTGFYRFGLPVAMSGDVNGPVGNASLSNPGIATIPAGVFLQDGAGLTVFLADSMGAAVSGTAPYAVGPGDSVLISGSYEPATP